MIIAPAAALLACTLLVTVFTSNAQLSYSHANRLADASASFAGSADDSRAKSGSKLVHGVIQGQQGVLVGATVWLRGTRTIAVTNSEGEFELRVPADAKIVELRCSYGGLQDETVRLMPAQALGSVYLLRSKEPYATGRLATTRP